MPERALPELKISRPLVPDVPLFAFVMITLPLLVAVPSPLCCKTTPPEEIAPRAASSTIRPPLPEVPLPTEIETCPARPAVVAPVPKQRAPLLPAELPLLNTRCPLAPDIPALEPRITTVPLLEAVPSPERRPKWPPVSTALRPAVQNMLPPTPLVPWPTAKRAVPPDPAVVAPLPRCRWPLLPSFDPPELKIRRPLAPAVPPFALFREIEPLLVVVPSPPCR